MRRPVTVLADGLGHPEGPDILPDGRVVFVETFSSRLAVWERGRGVSAYADCGGGPNACMLGSDGAVYITQNGGTAGRWRAEVQGPPSIQRAWPDGRVEVVVTEVGGVPLGAPNDLTFGPDGRLYFTDPGEWDPENKPDPGYLFALNPDGSGEVLAELGHVYPNGIAAEADGSLVWVESYPRLVRRRRPDGIVQELCRLPEDHIPDGLKVAANGDLYITSVTSGGIDVVARDGTGIDFLETGGVPLNCVFAGTSLYVTDFGVFDTSGPAGMDGRLLEVEVGAEGMPLFRGAIS